VTTATLEEDAPNRVRDRFVYAGVFVVAITFFLYCWNVEPGHPPLSTLHASAVNGWYGGASDQINYAREARALAHGTLPGIYWDYTRQQVRPNKPPNAELADYAYGLGYPVLGVPSIWLGLRGDPFVIPDGIAFGAAACLVFAISRRFFDDRIALLLTAAIVFATPMVNYFATPWNTIPTAIAILIALYIGVSRDRSWRAAIAFGIVASLALSARYVDIVWILAVIAPVVLLDFRRAQRIVVVALPLLLATTGIMLWSQDRVFGDALETPLHFHIHDGTRGDDLAEYNLRDVPQHALSVIVTADMSNGLRAPIGHNPLLRDFFWLLAAPVGFVALLRRNSRRALIREPAGALACAAAVSVLASIMYLSYWSGGGDDIQNENGRFFVAWFPLWGILAAIGTVAVFHWAANHGFGATNRAAPDRVDAEAHR
jgi:hypothetical protein